jgi:hypothetical protein
MPWPPSDHGRACRGKQLHALRRKRSRSGTRRNPLLLLWFSVAFLIVANGVTQARSISSRVAHQEIRFEEKLDAGRPRPCFFLPLALKSLLALDRYA